MRKRILSIALAISMILPAYSAGAIFKDFKNDGNFQIPQNPRQIPADVYHEPYMDTVNTTVYAPWLKNYHMMSQDEWDAGTYGGEACQQVRQLEISPVNPQIMYFGTDTSGVYKTTNGGKNWYNVTGHAPAHCTKGLLCDPFDENIVYAGYRSMGFFRTKDGGRTWEFLIKDRDTYKVKDRADTIACDGAGNVFIAAGSGIYRIDRKTDKLVNLYPDFKNLEGTNGATWYDLDVSSDGQIIYACCVEDKNTEIKNGIYASYDGGKTWAIKGTNDKQVFSPYSIALHPENPNEVYVGTSITDLETNKTGLFGLYLSKDGCETFERIYEHVYVNREEGVEPHATKFTALQFGPKDENGVYRLYYAGISTTYPLHESRDYGKTWEQVYKKSDRIGENTIRMDYTTGKTYTGWLYQAFDVDMHNPDRIVFGASGIYEKLGDKITRISAGFSGVAIVDVARDSTGKAFMPGMDVGAYVTNGPFTTTNFPSVYELSEKYFQKYAKATFDPNDDNHVIAYYGHANGDQTYYGIRQSYDGGLTMAPKNADAELERPVYGNALVLQYDDTDPNTIYMSYHNSYDNGKTWVRNQIDGVDAFILDIHDSKPNVFLGMTGTGEDTKLYLSEDKGKTWKYACSPGFNDFIDVFFDGGDDSRVWYSRDADFGTIDLSSGQLDAISTLLGFEYFDRLAQNPDNPDHLLVSSSPGIGSVFNDFKIAESRDGGKNWVAVPGFWCGDFHKILFNKGSTQVYITSHAGTFIYDFAEFHKYMDSKIKIKLNGKEVTYSEQPKIVNGRTMVPMRELFEQLGATVNYNDETRLITASKDGIYISLTPGNEIATVNGKEHKLDSPAFITEKGRTMVPIRFIAESLNVGVGWSEKTRSVLIKSAN